MLLCAEEEREYTPIKNKTSTKRQKDRLLKKSVRFSFTDKETEEHTTLSSIVEINL